jgi:4-hydroxybenzoate polyprenyltransferase
VRDRDVDRVHPLKQSRPIASGQLSPGTALTMAALLASGGVFASLLIGVPFLLTALTYLALLGLYSTSLKHIVIIDVLALAGGFVLRAIAGAEAVDVPISSWLLVCTTLLALFLALGKRRHELTLLGETAVGHRRILVEYSPYLLDQMISVVTASTVIAYTVYATSAETAARVGTPRLGLSIPFVLYGIFRYLYLVHRKDGGGSPAAMLLTDRPLLVCVGLWAFTVAVLMYSPLGR